MAWQTSKIYTLPIQGGTPRLVTPKNGCFWHGISPDGNTHIYTALRNNQWDIYAISDDGGDEVQLTNSSVQDDGSEFSPDGGIFIIIRLFRAVWKFGVCVPMEVNKYK
jgi:Tol biopolymer transport system component